KPEDLVRPGHIFPLIAKDGGVLVRTGHTEGSVDLCHLAGLSSSAVICEIIKEDGTMARRDDLDIFGEKHNLKTIFISDLVEYRLANEKLVTLKDEQDVEFFGMRAKKYIFADHDKKEHVAIVFHKVSSKANVRVHNVISDMELLLDQKKYDKLINSIEYLKRNGGVLVFINKPAYKDNLAIKEYGIGAQMLKHLGVEKMNLLTSQKDAEFIGLSGFGLEVSETTTI
ncbi:MAG: 3,4-dihydroxy-2-butanone-4-phosphate synthase, partial [Sulfurimonas sp.]